MGFQDLLHWIVGKRPAETAGAPVAGVRERRRFQRIEVNDGLVTLGDRGPFPISNLSYGGLRFDAGASEDGEASRAAPPTEGKAASEAFAIGQVYEARVNLHHVQLAATLKVCNVQGALVGCAFEKLSATQSRILSDILKPRIIGASLQEIDAAAIQNRDPNLRLRWFQGEDGAQIFLWQTLEGQTVKEEYYFLDYVITWDNRMQVLQTGRLRQEGGGKPGYGRIDPTSVAFFQVPSHRALKMGKVILEHATLPPGVRDPLLNGMAREERRLYHRYVLKEGEAGVKFHLGRNREGTLSVTNLSYNGLGVLLPEQELPRGLARGQELEGELQIGAEFIRVRVQLAYVTPQVAGGFMRVLDPAQNERLAEFLAPRLLGQALEELPAPMEEKPIAPSGARGYLFVGLHNTHLLALVAPGARLVHGRIAFMDRTLNWERNALVAYACPCGVIFPRDWELPSDAVERLPEVPAELRQMCRLMIESASLPEEVRAAWMNALTG
ncbi:MAG: hypothetical protein OZSIB_0510 [Candidatus Ozemobacter sibiricus]|uniref:Uncharacterized protein n=1 Tax=Candidatus Ozemobacter sibiricus TaxID=2268124 RepID=A0A367ZMH3_9BACT|nr:MAG: hypothetical protein OZSIB_0510 [Candidatus Ozemobacter sibiricus]